MELIQRPVKQMERFPLTPMSSGWGPVTVTFRLPKGQAAKMQLEIFLVPCQAPWERHQLSEFLQEKADIWDVHLLLHRLFISAEE